MKNVQLDVALAHSTCNKAKASVFMDDEQKTHTAVVWQVNPKEFLVWVTLTNEGTLIAKYHMKIDDIDYPLHVLLLADNFDAETLIWESL